MGDAGRTMTDQELIDTLDERLRAVREDLYGYERERDVLRAEVERLRARWDALISGAALAAAYDAWHWDSKLHPRRTVRNVIRAAMKVAREASDVR